MDQFLPVEVVYEMTLLLLRHEAAIHQLVVLLVLIQSRLVHGLRDVVKHRLLLELLDLALELGILLRLFCTSVGPLLVMAHLVQYVHVDLLGPPMHLGARLHLRLSPDLGHRHIRVAVILLQLGLILHLLILHLVFLHLG